jgi:prepilin-type processing-associated H-X9-DG protein
MPIPCKSSLRGRRGAFALVELLVVIGIIAVLIGLLLPALRGAWEQAQSVQCLSNLRQFVMAAHAYCNDHKGLYPSAYYSVPRPPVFTTYSWDFTTVRDTSAGTTVVTPGLLWLGRGDVRVQQCPSYDGASNTASDPYTGYNYNTSYIGHGGTESIRTPARVGQVRSAAGTALFGDGQYAAGANKYMRAPFPNPGDASFSNRSAGTQGFRHRGRTNVAFCDGHAESLAERFTSTSDAAPVAPRTGFLSADNSMYDLE